MSIFHIKSYNGSYLSCFYVLCPMKLTAFIDESPEKDISFSSTHGDLKSYLKLQEEKYLNKTKYIFCNYPF